jgi:ankyrin repeat protein
MGCSETRPDTDKQKLIQTKDSKKYQFEIYAAFKLNKQDEIKQFIQTCFDIKYKMPSFMGRTVLHLAAEFSDKRLVAYLIDSGADINALDYYGCPPIFVAMKAGKLDIVNAILDIGTNVNVNIVTNHNLSFHDFINKAKYKESVAILKKINYSKLNILNHGN